MYFTLIQKEPNLWNCLERGAQTPGARLWLHFLQSRQIFLGPQCGTRFISPFRRPKFRHACWVFGESVPPWTIPYLFTCWKDFYMKVFRTIFYPKNYNPCGPNLFISLYATLYSFFSFLFFHPPLVASLLLILFFPLLWKWKIACLWYRAWHFYTLCFEVTDFINIEIIKPNADLLRHTVI